MVQGLYDFWLKELADYYIEALKPVMKGEDQEARKAALNTLYICLDSGLRMLHPTMPYLTEELFQRLPHRAGEVPESICIAPFPTGCISFASEDVESQVASLQAIVSKFRSQFAALNIAKNANPTIFVKCNDKSLYGAFASETEVFKSLIRAGECTILSASDAEPSGCLASFISDDLTVYIKVEGVVDIKLEIERVNKRNAQLIQLRDKLVQKINMKGYADKVPEQVRNENTDKL